MLKKYRPMARIAAEQGWVSKEGQSLPGESSAQGRNAALTRGLRPSRSLLQAALPLETPAPHTWRFGQMLPLPVAPRLPGCWAGLRPEGPLAGAALAGAGEGRAGLSGSRRESSVICEPQAGASLGARAGCPGSAIARSAADKAGRRAGAAGLPPRRPKAGIPAARPAARLLPPHTAPGLGGILL